MRSSRSYRSALVAFAGLALPIAAASAQFTVAGSPISCTPASVNACVRLLGPCAQDSPCDPLPIGTSRSDNIETFVFELGRTLETTIEWGPWCVIRDTKSSITTWSGFAHQSDRFNCDNYDCGPCNYYELGIESQQEGPDDTVCGPHGCEIDTCSPEVYCPLIPDWRPEYPMFCQLQVGAEVSWSDPANGSATTKSRYTATQSNSTITGGQNCSAESYGYAFANSLYVTRETLEICKGTPCSFEGECDPFCGDAEKKMRINHRARIKAGVCWVGSPTLPPDPRGGGTRITWRVREAGATGWGAISTSMGALEYQPNGTGLRAGFLAGSPGSGLDTLLDGATNGGTSVTVEGYVDVPMTAVEDYIAGLTGVTSVEIDVTESQEDFIRDGRMNADAKVDWDDRRVWNTVLGLTISDEDFRFAYDFDLDGDIDIADQNAYTLYYDANAPCRADCGDSSGGTTLDGALDNGDEIRFINEYFGQLPSVDVGVSGGLPGSDGIWDNNDWIVYYSWFFGSCI